MGNIVCTGDSNMTWFFGLKEFWTDGWKMCRIWKHKYIFTSVNSCNINYSIQKQDGTKNVTQQRIVCLMEHILTVPRDVIMVKFKIEMLKINADTTSFELYTCQVTLQQVFCYSLINSQISSRRPVNVFPFSKLQNDFTIVDAWWLGKQDNFRQVGSSLNSSFTSIITSRSSFAFPLLTSFHRHSSP